MEEFFKELRLSRAFMCEFEEFLLENPKLVPENLLNAYTVLKQHYDYEMNRELS